MLPSGIAAWMLGLPVLLLVTGLAAFLIPHWKHNPDLPHGWFMPLVFLLLIHESRTRGAQRYLTDRRVILTAITGALLAGLAALCLGVLYMAVLEWSHALVVLMMVMSGAMLLLAAWLAAADARTGIVPFNWIAAAAILLWLLCVPLPPGTYAVVTQFLQGLVTETVLQLLHFFGIAAAKQGNIIQLTNTTVGIEEACSGIRSLWSCLFTGVFLSATLVRRRWPRVFIVAIAVPLAVGMNVLRSFTLTLLAREGVDITGGWHDVTGYAVLGVTAVLLAGLALRMEKGGRDVSSPQRQRSENGPARPDVRVLGVVVAGYLAAVVVVIILLVNLKPANMPTRPAPDLTAVLPGNARGWQTQVSGGLDLFYEQLQTRHLAQIVYQRTSLAGAEPDEISVYLAYWSAGSVPVSLVATHTPDACWPGAGWNPLPFPGPTPDGSPAHDPSDATGLFREAEHRVFRFQGLVRHVWFWHIHDGRVIHPANVRSPRQLLLLAWKYGFKKEGEQLFVRISSNLSAKDLEKEPLFQEIFARLRPFGL